jgi:hypothetical protein
MKSVLKDKMLKHIQDNQDKILKESSVPIVDTHVVDSWGVSLAAAVSAEETVKVLRKLNESVSNVKIYQRNYPCFLYSNNESGLDAKPIEQKSKSKKWWWQKT